MLLLKYYKSYILNNANQKYITNVRRNNLQKVQCETKKMEMKENSYVLTLSLNRNKLNSYACMGNF